MNKEDKFSMARTFTVMKRVIRQITRDKRTFGMIIVMPIIIMIIFGIALSGEVNNVPVIVENLDNGPAGALMLSSLQDDDRVSVKEDSFSQGIDLVEEGELFASIQIPQDFSAKLQLKKTGDPNVILSIGVYIDATKPSIKGSILGALQDAIQRTLGDFGVEFDEQIAYNGAEYTGLDVAIPAVMGFVLTFLVLLLSLLTMVRENIGGTQFRLYATPLTKTERLLGYVLALTLFGFIEALAILLIGILVFGAVVTGSVLLLLFSAFLYAMVNVLLSVFLSNFAENELQAVQMAPLTALPSMALSGMLVPVNSLPPLAQSFAQLVPLTYGIRILEGIMLKGFGFTELWQDFLILGFIIILLAVLSMLTVKDRIHA